MVCSRRVDLAASTDQTKHLESEMFFMFTTHFFLASHWVSECT